jgi:5-methylcytosine-specific restriction endonuclease McrA
MLGIIGIVLLVIVVKKFIHYKIHNSVEYVQYITEGAERYFQMCFNVDVKRLEYPVRLSSLDKFRRFDADAFVIDLFENEAGMKEYYSVNIPDWLNQQHYYNLALAQVVEYYNTYGVRGWLKRSMIRRELLKYCALMEALISKPVIVIQCTYISPKGRNWYVRKEVYTLEDVLSIIQKVEERITHKQNSKYERSLLTPGLRYDILKRDNFTCRYCGATANDGAKLHVDHIKPISKGGKTVASNLQTLCAVCNLGKSDKYEEV